MTEQTYVERPPVAALADVVSSVWVQHVPADAPAYRHRTIPNGSAELACRVGAAPELVGPRTAAGVDLLAPGSTVVGMRLRPGSAAALLRAPAPELVDRTVEAGMPWARAGLDERIAAAPSPAAAAAVLEAAFAAAVMRDGPRMDPLVREAVRRLMPARATDVRAVQRALHLSERQLRRRCETAIGLAPKALQRMLRFQGFLALAQHAFAHGGSPAGGLARLAAEAGYADQPHLTRESRRLAGVAPGELLRDAARHCAPGHDHAASYGPFLRLLRAGAAA